MQFVEQWVEMTDKKWILSTLRNGFKIIFESLPLLSDVMINLIQFSPHYWEKRSENFSRNGQWKGYEIREFPVFTPGYY